MKYGILGIDPGTRDTGVAFMEVDKNNKILSIETLNINAFEVWNNKYFTKEASKQDITVEHRIELILERLTSFIEDKDIHTVAIEGPFFNPKRPGVYAVLLELVALIKAGVSKGDLLKYQLNIYQPQYVKKINGVNKTKWPKGTKTKDKVLATMKKVKPITTIIKGTLDDISEHEVDAIAVAYTQLTQHNTDD